MGSCLVTKLRQAINNDDLKPFDTLVFKITPITGATDSQRAIQVVGNNVTVKATNGANFTYDGTDYSTYNGNLGWKTLLMPNESCQVAIYPASNITYIGPISGMTTASGETVFSMNVSGLNGANMTFLSCSSLYTTGVFAPAITSRITQIVLGNSSTTTTIVNTGVDLDAFVGCETLQSISCVRTVKTKGSIESLGSVTSLTSLNVADCSLVGGEINDLAAAQVAAGRTSGSIAILPLGTNMTDDGNAITSSYIASKGGSFRITINFNSSATGGYTKSYS